MSVCLASTISQKGNYTTIMLRELISNCTHTSYTTTILGEFDCVIILVAPYCAIPRDYLSDTPLFRAMGFLVSQHGQLGAISPPPFLSVSPLESMQSGGAIPPPQKGYLCDTCAIPCANKANGCHTPLCDTISKVYCAIFGGISHRAAKVIIPVVQQKGAGSRRGIARNFYSENRIC